MDDDEREQALVVAFSSERSSLQAAYTGTITEANGRLSGFLAVLSAAIIGLGLVAGKSALVWPFLATVLPIVLILGEFTFLRLAQTMTESDLLAVRIQQVRAWYRDHLMPDDGYFAEVAPTGQSASEATWTDVGVKPRWWQFLLTAAATVGAINALLFGAGLTIALAAAGVTLPVAVVVGVAGVSTFFAAHLIYIMRGVPTFRRGDSPRDTFPPE
ncbi:hypothetical protein OG767_20935 [Micromonospora sp. NBC_01392]|uniref:hypothetical protein n=1 Tax=Micromonospora sp. NBC_01392 TaxID=2903588 RepID=UPI00324C310C